MDNESEVIRQQMEDTRSSLTDKLEALEQQVSATVQGAASAVTAVADTVENVKEAVQGSVEAVKETVQETVAVVKDTFDLKRLTDRYPWAVVGGAAAAGCLAGWLLSRPRAHWLQAAGPSAYPAPAGRPEEAPARPAAAPSPPELPKPGLLSQLGEQFGPEIAKLKGLAIGTLFGIVRDLLTKSAPDQMRPKVADVVNDITTKLGGEPIQGPLLKSAAESPPEARGAGAAEYDPAVRGRPAGAVHRKSQATAGAAARR